MATPSTAIEFASSSLAVLRAANEAVMVVEEEEEEGGIAMEASPAVPLGQKATSCSCLASRPLDRGKTSRITFVRLEISSLPTFSVTVPEWWSLTAGSMPLEP